MSRHIVYECYCVLHLLGFNYFTSVWHRYDDDYDDNDEVPLSSKK